MFKLPIVILIPFILAFVIPYLYKKLVTHIHTGWFVFFIPLGLFLYLTTYIADISSGHTIITSFAWIPSLDINLTTYLDGLSLIFALLITGIGALVVLYSIFYLNKEREALANFYVYLLLFMGSMLGLVLSDNVLVLYVFWEITSITSFLLIAYWFEREKSRYGALKSLLITVLGGLAMLAGFIMLSIMADTYSIRTMLSNISLITSHHWFVPAMVLILLAAFTKSAQFPFSIWLPDAMEAPTPISAYIHCATMVKAGIYLVARLTPVFGGSLVWFWLISGIGLITLIYGAFNAIKQMDLKALLAYSTVSQLGLIMCLLGLGSAAMYFGSGNEGTFYAFASFVAIFHLINHATFKGLLFMVVGIIDHETGTRDIRRLGGLMQLMPVSFTLMAVGAFAMAGLPPFNGFLSKEMFFTATLNITQLAAFNLESWGGLFPIIAWLASIFTFVYCMILVFKTFAGRYQAEKIEKPAREASAGIMIAPIVLAALVVGFFFFPQQLANYLIKPAWMAIFPTIIKHEMNIAITAWHGFNTELLMTIGIVILGILLYANLPKWRKIYNLYPAYLTINNLYDKTIELTEAAARKITDAYMSGYIRDYLLYIFAFFIIISSLSIWLLGGFTFDFTANASFTFYEVILIISLLIAALIVPFTASRLTSIIATCAVGFLVAAFFVLFRAPDLALTQLVVETVSTVLFLLCFYHLPKLRPEIARLPFKLVNALIAVGVGITVTIIALAAQGARLFPSISNYYTAAYELAGAKNIVNAILVDFRGFDTMLEITVLLIAGLGVYTLIKLAKLGGHEDE